MDANQLTVVPDSWQSGEETIYPKNSWKCLYNGRTFQVSKSSFGWHVNEWVAGEFNRHALGPVVFASKRIALQAIIDGA